MAQFELPQLTRAEALFDAGKLDEAYVILRNLINDNELNFDQKVHIQFLIGLICVYQHKGEEVIEVGAQISSEAQKLKLYLSYLDGVYLILIGLVISDKFEQISELIEKAEIILNSISNIPETDLKLRQSRITLMKAWDAFRSGKINLSEELIQTTLNFFSEFENNFEKAWAYLLLVQINIQIKSQLELSMENSKKALSIAKRIKFSHYWIAYSYIGIGATYSLLYEYDLSMEYHMKSLEIFRQIKNNWFICNILNNIGGIYCDKGEYKLSLKYLEESLELWERDSLNIEACLDNMIYVALQIGDLDRAHKLFNRLEERYNQKKDDAIRKIVYLYNKAVLLKTSLRIRDIAEAEKLFKQIVLAENAFFDYKLNGYIHLCDILVTEFHLSYNDEILEELNEYIPLLLTMAEKTHSYLVFCETFILQAKLALLQFDINSARRYLTQAQKIAESKGIRRLAIKISYEHDKLIEQLNVWNSLKESETPIPERWKLAGLKEQMEIMKKKGLGELPDILDEKPVFLLVVSEGGVPIFSQSFSSDTSFKEHLFGGFFTTINRFITENFSEGLDRASFGNYTLLMNAISPFLIVYIYKGQSYSAQKRLSLFLDKIRHNVDTWDSFKKFYETNREVEIKDIPNLESLIKETFLMEVS
jgi:tetratricopeptide (TPR) repeat protein